MALAPDLGPVCKFSGGGGNLRAGHSENFFGATRFRHLGAAIWENFFRRGDRPKKSHPSVSFYHRGTLNATLLQGAGYDTAVANIQVGELMDEATMCDDQKRGTREVG